MSQQAATPFVPGWQRPIRIPDAIEPSYAEPPVATVEEVGTWRMPFRLARDIAPGDQLRLQLYGGRNNYGAFAPIDGRPLLTAETDDGRELPVSPLPLKGQRLQYGTFVLGVPDGGLAAGATVTVTIGPSGNARAWERCVRNKFALLYVGDAGNNGVTWTEDNADAVVAACLMHIVGGPVDHLYAYAPPHAQPGRPLTVTVRPQDRYGNLASVAPSRLAVELDGHPLPAAAEPVAESTAVRLTVSLPREGVFRLVVRDPDSGAEATSNPIVCAADAPQPRAQWGMIHGHSEISDGTGTLDEYFRQLREECGLDFGATADHDHAYETPDAYWQKVCRKVRRYNDPPRFVALLGYEFAKWRRRGEGDRNVYYLRDDRPMYRSGAGHYVWPKDLFAALEKAGETAMVIPHHTGTAPSYCDWQDHDSRRERLVEIHQVRGSYECAPDEGNPRNERGQAEPMNPVGTIRNALAMGWRVGFTAGGDDHTGRAGSDCTVGQEYKAGSLCAFAAGRTREAIWQALWDRRTVATSGPRVLLSYTLNGKAMGSEIAAAEAPGVRKRRTLHVVCHAMAPIRSIDIIRSGGVVHSVAGDGLDLEMTWHDDAPLGEVLLPPSRHCDHPFAYYYVRMIQEDGEAAWASPVWIDP